MIFLRLMTTKSQSNPENHRKPEQNNNRYLKQCVRKLLATSSSRPK